jgi:hypothetical protein
MFGRPSFRRKAWMALLLGAWLPVVVTCEPPGGTIVISDWDWWPGAIYVDDCCWDDDDWDDDDWDDDVDIDIDYDD